jgi:hypothetical protein
MPEPFLIAGILQNLAAVRPIYVALWCGLAVLSGGLVVSMRSRWGRKNPFYRCAVASLLVHVLLVGLTMTVRHVVGEGGAGMGQPIHVKLVDDIQVEGPITLAAPPELLVVEEPKPEEVAKTASDEVAELPEAEPVLESPPLYTPPEPVEVAKKKIVIDETVAAAEPEVKAEVAPVVDAVTPIEGGPEIVAANDDRSRAIAATEMASAVPAASPYA